LPEISQPFACKNLAGNGCFCDTSKAMTVQIDVDEKIWAEAESLAKDLNIDFKEMFLNTLRSDLYRLKEAKLKQKTIAEKEQKHRESYEKYPVQPDEFYVDEEQLIEAWKDL
jgi:hypothetical protein